MASHVGTYEAMFVLNASYATGSWDTAKGEVEHILHRANAEILHIRKWDERRLTYEIDKNKRAVFVLAYFKCEGSKVAGVERDVQLSENILRVLVMRAEHLTLKDVEGMQPQQPVVEEHDNRAFRRAGFEQRPREQAPVVAAAPAPVEQNV